MGGVGGVMPRRQLGMSSSAQGAARLRAVSDLRVSRDRFGYLTNTSQPLACARTLHILTH